MVFSSISTCCLPVQAKLPSLQLKVNSNYFLPVKYISNLVVIVDRFLSKAWACKDKIKALSHMIEGHWSKLKHYYKEFVLLRRAISLKVNYEKVKFSNCVFCDNFSVYKLTYI